MIEATRAPEENVFVLGISYGTYLAQRYLQVAPDQAAGVIFDSICAADRCYLSEQDQWENRVAEQIMNRCADEPECAMRLGDTPWSTVETLFAAASEPDYACQIGTSPEQTKANLRTILATLMFSGPLRRVAPAFVHRMLRCNASDQAALQTMINNLFGGTPAPSSYSFPLGVNIAIAELWEPGDPSAEELDARNAETFSARGVSAQLGWQTEGWPRYSDPLAGQLPSASVPALMMNASLDPATPLEVAQPLGEALNGPNQHFVEIPGSAHGVVTAGPLVDDPNTTCGRILAIEFMKDPTAPLDTSCLQRTLPLGFSVSPGLANFVFGTPDIWGD